MGASAPQKTANMVDNLERGLITPTEILARAIWEVREDADRAGWPD
jgi:hypothetical protein